MKSNVSKLSLNQRDELWLNEETKIILMRPNENLFFRYATKIDDFNRMLQNPNWSSDPKNLDFADEVIRPFLCYCVRSPDDYHKKLIVDERISNKLETGQEFYEDFNPTIDLSKLVEQDIPESSVSEIKKQKVRWPKLQLFFTIMSKSGWFTPAEAQETEKFPADGEGDEKVNDSGVLQGVSEPSK